MAVTARYKRLHESVLGRINSSLVVVEDMSHEPGLSPADVADLEGIVEDLRGIRDDLREIRRDQERGR